MHGEPKNISARLARLVSIWRGFWFGPTLVILAALAVLVGLRILDRRGASDWLVDQGVALASDGDAYSNALETIVTVQAGFATLYVSITLIVLTLAAGGLGPRLIDRWIARPFVRRTLGYFLGALAASVALLVSLNAGMPAEKLPQASLLFVAALTLGMIAWLAVALHDLARASFVDTSIAWIKRDCLSVPPIEFRKILETPWPDKQDILAPRAGYISATDIKALSKLAADHDTMFRLDRTAGDHVMAGQPIAVSQRTIPPEALERFHEQIGYDETRSDREGLSYRVRLLVELAGRALSPGINDFYTARAAVDALATVMAHECGRVTGPAQLLMEVDRVICPTASFAMIFDRPMDSLRQSAAAYPAIATRIIERLGTAAAIVGDDDFTAKLRDYAGAVADHAIARAETRRDADDIRFYYSQNFGAEADEDAGRRATVTTDRRRGNAGR